MKKYVIFPLLALAGGACGFAVRLLQDRTGFESDTGLPVSGNPYALLLPVLLAALAALLCLLVRKLPGERGETPRRFQDYFSCGGNAILSLLVTGIFLWLASGAYDVYAGLAVNASILQTALGALTLLTAACLFPVVPACRRGAGKPLSPNLLLSPVVYLVIRLILAYREDSVNPSLLAYYVELLALVFLVLSYYRASSFAFRAGRTHRFALYALLAIVLSITTLADRHSASALLMYAGGAVQTLSLLLLRLSAVVWAETPAGEEGSQAV
jgi:hypothetical protein